MLFKRIHNLLSIIDSVIKIQNNWRKKKSLDNYNQIKDNQNKIKNMLNIIDKNITQFKFSDYDEDLSDDI